ncbi:hypothetical protein GMD4S_11326 [Streptococcus sp. GMD4S]|uniref:hypothetical protein n=1 Tax=unclassified Streptococcus TaxID=2608887 RepID=UPI000280DB96|nr:MULTISPECIES: hypothetical protein [unclassified Streptococcus]EKA01395.1 hypothetical protein GMD6S_10420 [Streptococcus sp. GMD6S]EKA02736.1 hypothetical protein GMD4S_11326 [Streptococcus sp. GMD4S]EKA10128.1 hypothetical protein GMD2S_09564 [Streptococcus sp. GMD2S]EKA13284.1 hypothetical protein GMD1S_09512 [Streptococcus sp. GMD1S]
MIDRSYLPYQSAREYQDSGMQKWMGFFLSEHTTSLGEEKYRVDLTSDLNRTEKLLLLSQLYVGNLKGRFIVKQKAKKTTLIGEVGEIAVKAISIKTLEGCQLIEVEDILDIQLLEEVVYE